MKQFIILSGLTIVLLFGGCSNIAQTNLGVSTINSNGWLGAAAIEDTPPAPKILPASVVSKIDIILLPKEDGTVGKVIVSDNDKTTFLNQAWQKTETKHLEKKEILSKEIIDSKYSELRKAVPEEPHNYRIYFKHNSTDIAKDSNILIQIIEDINSNPTLQIDVIGYCDRAGDDAYNKNLSMKRAQKVIELLKNQGVNNEIISLDYYGEENPIVPTEDGVANDLNRRVEVTIK